MRNNFQKEILSDKKTYLLSFPFLNRYGYLNCGMILKNKGDPQRTLLELLTKDQKQRSGYPKLVIPKQRHTRKVLPISSEDDLKLLEKSCFDGFLTKLKNVYLCIQVADCIPLFGIAPEKKMVGLLHVGWRGLVSGILTEFLSKVKKEFKVAPQDLMLIMGPHIRGCCYEVSCGVAALFDRDTLICDKKRIKVNLEKALLKKLR